MKIIAKFGSERLEMKSDWDLEKVHQTIKEAKLNGFYEFSYSSGIFVVPLGLLYWNIECDIETEQY